MKCFIHSFLTNMFRPIWLPSEGRCYYYNNIDGANVVSCVAVSPQQLKIIIISVQIT
jgi:hypothetical protein